MSNIFSKFHKDILDHFAINRENSTKESPLLDTLSAEVLADMYDLTKKFGIMDDQGHLRIQLDKSSPIISLGEKHGKNMIVFDPEGVTGVGTSIICFKSGMVVWDGRVTVQQISMMISQIDAKAFEHGWISTSSGNRLPQNLRSSRESFMEVEKAFSTPGAMMPVFPGQDEEKMVKDFDHPEVLRIGSDPMGGKYIYHMRDHEHIQRCHDVATRILTEEGINNIDDIANISMERLMEIRGKIDQALSGLSN